MMSPQEGRFTKIAAIAGVIGLVIAFLAWIYPFAPRSDASATATGRTTASSEPPAQPSPGPTPFKPPVHPQLNPAKPSRACDAPETATLRPGAPARVASGLAVLSVKTAREGSEPYLTLGIVSDRDTLTQAVLGAPARFHFKTSLGAYFVNVAEADLAAGATTVQVGCEAEGNTP